MKHFLKISIVKCLLPQVHRQCFGMFERPRLERRLAIGFALANRPNSKSASRKPKVNLFGYRALICTGAEAAVSPEAYTTLALKVYAPAGKMME